MPPHTHLVQNQLEFDNVPLLTLAARAAIILTTQFNNPTSTFLMKRIRYLAQFSNRSSNDDGPILIGCANGDANVSEIAEAMNERNVNGPEDITNVLDQDKAWVVYQDTVRPFVVRGDQAYGQVAPHWTKFPGKNGTPALETSGMVVFAYNAGVGALTTGMLINGIAHIQGVWLRD